MKNVLANFKRRPLPTTTSIKYTIPTDPYLLSTKFRELAKQPDKLDDAVALVMQTKTKYQSVVVWNQVVDEYSRRGRLSRALRAFSELRKRGFTPTSATYVPLIRACGISDTEQGVEIALELLDQTNIQDIKIENAMLGVLQRKGRWQELLDRFNQLPSRGPMAPDLVSYTVVMTCLVRELKTKLERLQSDLPGGSTKLKFGEARQRALLKQAVHRAFGALETTWLSLVDDCLNRKQNPDPDTPALYIDARVINTLLRACHMVYLENRPLARLGFRIIDQTYMSQKDRQPLALQFAKAESPVLDKDTVRMALDLYIRDKEPVKAKKFWKSLEHYQYLPDLSKDDAPQLFSISN